jgi:threonine/homoserine/homoserine lactone efflux protein
LALSASPGPSMAYVMARSIGQSRSAGIASTIGLALGGVLLAVIAASGLAAIFQTSTVAYRTVAFLGGIYLVYLGVQTIRAANGDQPKFDSVVHQSFARIVYQGIVVELLNPKTILFFMAFLPPFVDPRMGSVTQQMLVLGMLVPVTAVPSDLIVSFAGGSLAERLKENSTMRNVLKSGAGIVLIVIGVSIFFGDPASATGGHP